MSRRHLGYPRFDGDWVRADDCRERFKGLPRKQPKTKAEKYKTVPEYSASGAKAAYIAQGKGDFGLHRQGPGGFECGLDPAGWF